MKRSMQSSTGDEAARTSALSRPRDVMADSWIQGDDYSSTPCPIRPSRSLGAQPPLDLAQRLIPLSVA
jgi:hypothetical protein